MMSVRLLRRFDAVLHRWLVAHSIGLLRISLGVILLFFGVLKFFSHVSPVEPLTIKTTDALSFDLLPGHIAIVLIGALESIVGILLVIGRWLKVAVYLLMAQFVGVFAPLVLFTGRLFDGPHNAPTLEGQYVLKDFILLAAALVVVSTVPGLLPGADPAESRKRGTRRTDWTERR